MPESVEGGPQQAPAGVTSGGAGCGTTTEGSLAISSGGRLQIYPLRMTISSVQLWMFIPQAAADGVRFAPGNTDGFAIGESPSSLT
jgi:hypothetical protein